MDDTQTPAAGIEIRSLYKVFGPNAERSLNRPRRHGKAELVERGTHRPQGHQLEMPGGCIQVIMGPSGSGKSTLIRHINRLIDPTAGEVLVGRC